MSSSDTDPSSRRGRLLGLKLRALVREHHGADPGEPSPFALGAAIVVDEAAWLLLDDDVGPRLGAALAWARRAGVATVDIVTDTDAGAIARRAAAFRGEIHAWRSDGTQLVAAEPEPLPAPPDAVGAHLELRELIAAGGATPNVEHGVVFGEVRGLEVCRVVDDPDLGTVRLEVGVGVHDREAFALIHGDVPTVESLARIVDAVSSHRRDGADQHPLNRIARERFLRWQLEQRPDLVGAEYLRPAQPPVPRRNVKDAVPCVATGAGLDGELVTVVCSSGVDLELVPYAVDARLATGIDDGGLRAHRVVLAVPTRDRIELLDALVAELDQPAGCSFEVLELG